MSSVMSHHDSNRWQSFIEQELASGHQNNENGVKMSNVKGKERPRFGSKPVLGTATLGRRISPPKSALSTCQGGLTLPRGQRKPTREADENISELPALLNRLCMAEEELQLAARDERPIGIAALESVYAPMRNLGTPFTGTRQYAPPAPARSPDRDWDGESSSMVGEIPPLLLPVQSHAVLQQSLGHDLPVTTTIPRTPLSQQRADKKAHHPLFKRTFSSPEPSSLLKKESPFLRLSSQPVMESSQQRISLMSTDDSSIHSSDGETTGTGIATDVSSSTKAKPEGDSEWMEPRRGRRTRREASPCPSEELLSVSQQGDLESPELGEMSGNPPSHYMNILFQAVERQGGRGSVETALSPYLAMTKGRMGMLEEPLYAQPSQSGRQQSIADRILHSESKRPRSSSTSRLQDIASRMRRGSSKNKRPSASEAARAKLQMKSLLQEVERKRQYRVGLNLFNSQPENGVEYLFRSGFLEFSPAAVAVFLKDNSGLSQDKIGEYLGDLQNPFNMRVLSCFMEQLEVSGLRIDKALRHLLRYFRVPGEAQKIEKIMKEFSRRYNRCNPAFVAKLRDSDATITLAFAIMLLNTDLHTPNVKVENKMSMDAFLNNLRGVDNGFNFDPNLLKAIYKSIKKNPFESIADHVHRTQLLQRDFVGAQRPDLAEAHRRLVCICRLYEVEASSSNGGAGDTGKPRFGHARDLFLFNDLLVVTKKCRNDVSSSTYSYRCSLPLSGLEVSFFSTPASPFGLILIRKRDGKEMLRLNAGSKHDQYKFVMDLQESIFEMDLTEEERAIGMS